MSKGVQDWWALVTLCGRSMHGSLLSMGRVGINNGDGRSMTVAHSDVVGGDDGNRRVVALHMQSVCLMW